MSNTKVISLVAMTMLLSGILLWSLDTPLKSVSNNLNILKSHKSHHSTYPSPDVLKNQEQLTYHWRLSPIYSLLEDIFYPVRQWSNSPKEMVINQGTISNANNQFNSVIQNRDATEVRVRRAYFFAKRRNFKKDDLNQDYLNKQKQWLSLYQTAIESKLNIKYGTYNTQFFLMGLFAIVIFLWLISNRSIIKTMLNTAVLAILLVISSYTQVVAIGLPLHWFLTGLMIIKRGAPSKISDTQRLILGAYCLYLAAIISLIGACVGGAIIYFFRQKAHSKIGVIFSMLHPVGIAFMSHWSRRKQWVAFGSATLIMVGMQLIGQGLIFSMPIAYLTPLVHGVLGMCLVIVGVTYLQQRDYSSQSSPMKGVITGTVAMVIVSQFLLNPGLNLAAAFIMHPILYWFGIIWLLNQLMTGSEHQNIAK